MNASTKVLARIILVVFIAVRRIVLDGKRIASIVARILAVAYAGIRMGCLGGLQRDGEPIMSNDKYRYAQAIDKKIPFLCRLFHSWRMSKYHTLAEYFICERCRGRRIEYDYSYNLTKHDIEWLSSQIF